MNELSKCLNYMHYNESINQIVPAVARIGNVKYKNIIFFLCLCYPELYFSAACQQSSTPLHNVIRFLNV